MNPLGTFRVYLHISFNGRMKKQCVLTVREVSIDDANLMKTEFEEENSKRIGFSFTWHQNVTNLV